MKIGKLEKLLVNLNDKKKYVTQIRNFKQALDHGFCMEKIGES